LVGTRSPDSEPDTADRAPVRKGSAAPERRCALTRQVLSKDALIRFVADPQARVIPDLSCKLPGRGVWVTATSGAVGKAAAANVFARSLKQKVNVDADLAELTGRLLEARAVEALSLANKAGQVVAGFEKVLAEVSQGNAIALLHASDAAAGSKAKLVRRFRAVCAELERDAVLMDVLTIDQMSLALGRPNVVHAALKTGGAARNASTQLLRLSRYRTDEA